MDTIVWQKFTMNNEKIEISKDKSSFFARLKMYFHGISRIELFIAHDVFQKIDAYIINIIDSDFIFYLPSFLLFANILMMEVFYPSFLFSLFYLMTIREYHLFLKQILSLKYIQLFLVEPLFTVFSFYHMSMFLFLCNTNFYDKYFIYDECIICFEKKLFGIVADCCPYVRICHSCNKKINRCPICKINFH